jgi:hypothetical protein
MDLPNITLLFQMVHFVIAYIILYRLVFAPALAICVTQAAYKNNLEQKIVSLQSEHQEIKARAQSQWSLIRKKLFTLVPVCWMSCMVKKQPTPALEPMNLAESEKQKMVNMIKDKLADVS